MKLLADLHTHSKNSRFHHGKNSIEEMAIEANEIGLVEIGITDHGYAHFFRTTKEKLKEARKVVDEINKWSKTKVLLGIEADIISEDGTLDIDNETLSMLDILVVGYHKMIFTDFANFFGKTKKTEEAKRKCTNAFINAINKYPVTIVSHLDSILTTDLYEIGKACKERGTLVEINNRHTKWTEKQMFDLLASGCMFVVSSDAHSRENVGNVDRAMEYIRKYKIPSERVANVEFDEDEKSEADKAYSAYHSVYEQLAKEKREKEEKIEEKEQTEITGKLSDEMEKALSDIAAQKGLKYEKYRPETVEDEYMKNISDDDLNLIRQAEEYIQKHEMAEIQRENENVNAEPEHQETYQFNDDHPLMREDGFAKNFQAINSVIKQTEEQNQPVITEQPEEIKSNYIQNNNSSASAFEQLSTSNLSKTGMQGLKNLINEGTTNVGFEKNENRVQTAETQPKPSYKKPEPENFMDSITQTNLAKTVTEQAKPQQPQTAKKPQAQKTNRRGAFIVVDNLLDSDKK